MYSLGKDDLELFILLSPLPVLGLQVCVPVPGVRGAGDAIRDLTHVKEAQPQRWTFRDFDGVERWSGVTHQMFPATYG